MTRSLYCDHNAGSPPPAEVRAALVKAMAEPLANPSSLHEPGQRAADLLERARAQLATALGAGPRQVVFTSGGSEANALALGGVLAASRRPRLAISAVEHPSVARAAAELCRRGGRELVVLPVHPSGHLDLDAASSLVDAQVALVSCQLANHETGAVQPLAGLVELVRRHGCLLHVDAAQAPGRLPLRFADLGADLLSLSGPKLGAPAGIGALLVRDGTPLVPLSFAGHHERGLRPGTPNVLGAIGLGAACQAHLPRCLAAVPRLQSLRDELWRRLLGEVPGGVRISAASPAQLCQTLCVAFAGAPAAALVDELAQRGVAASAGAACRAGDSEPSAVLLAMGLAPELAQCALRLSLGIEHGVSDLDLLVQAVGEAVAAVRRHLGAGASA